MGSTISPPRRRILIISYYSLPRVMAASYRVMAWAKYLPRFGWAPVIVTRHWNGRSGAPWEEWEGAPSAEMDETAGCFIHRTGYRQARKNIWVLRSRLSSGTHSVPKVVARKSLSFLLRNFLLLPDEYVGWYSQASSAAASVIDRQSVDVLLATGAPWTSFLVARNLSRERGIPWVADYRDPWTQPTALGCRWDLPWLVWSRLTEKATLKTAFAATHVSEPWQEGLSRFLERKVHLVPNGYDPEQVWPWRRQARDSRHFTISFVGTLHPNTNPFIFLEGFRRFVDKKKLTPDACKVRFTGSGFERLLAGLDDTDRLRPYLHIEPAVTQPAAIQRMCSSHLLLLFPIDVEGHVPAKTYEYMASLRPILASPAGRYRNAIKDLLKRTRAGVIKDTPEEIEAWLLSRYDEFRRSGDVESETDERLVETFSRPRQVEKLAEILDEAARANAVIRSVGG